MAGPPACSANLLRRAATSGAVVVQGARWPRNTGNSAQVFIDGPQVALLQVPKPWPGHDLQELTVKGQVIRVTIVGVGPRRRTVQMQSIQIGARLDDEAKLLERAPSLGPSGFVGRQVPGNDDRGKWLD